MFTYKFTKIDIEESPLPDDMTLREAKQVEQIHSLLTALFNGVDDTGAIVDQTLFDDSITPLCCHLSGKNTKPLKFICGNIKLVPHKPNIQLATLLSNTKYFKKDWIECLIEWVYMDFPIILPTILMSSHKHTLTPYHSLGGYTSKLVMPELMQCIHNIIKDTVTPSWINSVPYNYGEAADGVLKADEWCNMATIFFPLVLISMIKIR